MLTVTGAVELEIKSDVRKGRQGSEVPRRLVHPIVTAHGKSRHRSAAYFKSKPVDT
jgi:hypothetical protein